ncbi:hypothetical protein HWC71_gp77 [Gordonia phage Sadboi]|uniref:Uncharacterized protein n=1 Tax=Gordonia phage Sadboi TaxID=2599849 RepID=A0A5J6TV59_9CAUD|nr:hypothetical protein HWC71_gp77 [Gordonia phage Sadboi]QFG14726.1 hypothetical protein PBI_SADBOI_77 [Gordonia phage Sadboi]
MRRKHTPRNLWRGGSAITGSHLMNGFRHQIRNGKTMPMSYEEAKEALHEMYDDEWIEQNGEEEMIEELMKL